jgi:hypothetical protein
VYEQFRDDFLTERIGFAGAAARGDRVNLVDEQDGRCDRPCPLEEALDVRRRLAPGPDIWRKIGGGPVIDG